MTSELFVDRSFIRGVRGPSITARCPHCGREVVLIPFCEDQMLNAHGDVGGLRYCPNASCNGLIFVVSRGPDLLKSFPAIKIDFDSQNIPEKIKNSFEEAVACHSEGLYVAAAIMVRRTLEEVCVERDARGRNLKERIADLKSKITIPVELFDAMDELRLLGNDAAHIEAQEYSEISEVEVSVAIDFAKEILKSLYQYSVLLSKLRSLKRQ